MTDRIAPIGEDDLQALIDGRLSPEREALVRAYLATNPDAAGRVEAERQQREALRRALDPVFHEPIPARLRVANLQAQRRTRWTSAAYRAAAALVLFFAGAALGWSLAPSNILTARAPTQALAQHASLAYRTFVVEVAHPVEVDASRQSHLVQWLSKRLGRPIAAPDLSSFGYKLMGGRLLPAGSGAAAQFMYDDKAGRRLTLFIQSGAGEETAFRFSEDGPASTFAWIDRGFGFAVTAPVERATLLPIAEAVYHRFDETKTSPTLAN